MFWRSLGLVAFWCLLALGFNAMIWRWQGPTVAVQFLAGYVLEWSLSMDNVFAFAVIFRYFQVPRQFQRRVLFWGILGAVVMRLGFILAGAALVVHFRPILPIFGAFLVYTAVKLARPQAQTVDPQRNVVLRLARRWLPMAAHSEVFRREFFVRENGRTVVTSGLLVLLAIESTDVLFAVDSVPAIFGITQDPFIVFTSNIFAILGLRALYLVLADVMDRFRHLHYGLAAVLGFVGVKMVAQWFIGDEAIPTWVSLAIIAGLLAASMLASVVASRGHGPAGE